MREKWVKDSKPPPYLLFLIMLPDYYVRKRLPFARYLLWPYSASAIFSIKTSTLQTTLISVFTFDQPVLRADRLGIDRWQVIVNKIYFMFF